MSKEDIFTGERFVPGIDDDEITIEHFQRYETILELVKGKDVVDAACGEGYGTSIIGTVAKHVIGFDISEEAVKRATDTYSKENVEYKVGDVSHLPLEDNSVEVFVSFETIEHIDEELQKKFVKEVSRVLKEDGIFIISSPNKEIYSDLFNYHNEFHIHEMYKGEFMELLRTEFEHVELFNQYLEVVSIIDSNVKQHAVAGYKKNNEIYTSDGKYFIAIASQKDISDIQLQSVYLKNDVTYRKNIARIYQLQEEVEERNTHLKVLDARILALENQIHVLENQMEEQEDIFKYEVKKRDELIRCKDVHIGNLDAIIAVKEAHLRKIKLVVYAVKHPIKGGGWLLKKIGGKILRKIKKVFKLQWWKKIEIPNCKDPLVSIVIPVYNQFQYTYECIKSIKNTVKNIPYEIIVGDDMSTDYTRFIKKVVPNIVVNINETDHGFLMNCNRAAKHAKGKYIVFLNNDTQVKEEWLSSLVELIESDENIGMVGSKLIYPDGRLQEAGGIIWNDASGWNFGRMQDPNMPEYNYVRECDYISGASIMIRKTLWEEIGGFDERFKPAYCEDSDLAFEVRKRGYKVLYQPKSVVIHFEGISNGTDLNAGLKKYQVENNVKFKEKWAEELSKQYENGQAAFCARERNYGKKVILFIDHYVPTYDKDAGSKTTFQYIEMFLSKGYIVKFLGDNFAQMEPYTTALQQMGVEVLYGSWYAEHIFEWLEANKECIDFAYLNRPHIAEKYVDFLRKKTNIKLIYYGHDLHFLRTQREAELTGNHELMLESKAWKKKEFDLMKKVSMVYYPSHVEEKAIHEIDNSIPVKAITAYVFEKFIENYTYDAAERSGILFVGGFSHGPNIDAVQWFAEKIYPKVKDKKDIPFIIVGSNAPDEIKALDGDGIIFKGFVSDEELAELYATCRMVVVPLRYGAGVKGKVVEAIYNGAPVVTTGVGAEGIDDIEGIVCIEDDPIDFANKIIELYDDYEKLAEIGRKTQIFIKENFSIEAAWSVIEDDFQ